MRKRITTLLLAMLLLFQTGAETFYAAEYAPGASAAGTEALTGDNNDTGDAGSKEPGTGDGENKPGTGDSENEPGTGDGENKPDTGDGTGGGEPGAPEESEEYTVTFDFDGGKLLDTEETQKQIQVKKGELIAAENIPAPVKEGYLLQYWTDESGTEFKFEEQPVEGNLTLKAYWAPVEEYTVVFDFNGGNLPDTGEPTRQIAVKGGELIAAEQIPVPVRKGYKLQYWMDETGAEYKFAERPVEGNLTLKAYWEPISYTIQFDAGGGTGTMVPITVVYDQPKKLPENGFEKRGYAFTGWTVTIAGVKHTFQDEAELNSNLTETDGETLTFTAVWEVGLYTVRYNANGGTGTMDDMPCTYNKNRTLKKNQFERTGYTFTGWNTKPDGTGTAYADKGKIKSLGGLGEIVILYAMWEGNPYTVKYDGNKADSGSVAGSSQIYGVPFTLKKNAFKRKGFTFAGWNTKADGTGTTYREGSQVSNLTAVKNGTVTLYAKWTAIQYKITYHTNGGKLAASAKKVYTTDKPFVLPRPTKKGYDFDGWYKTSNFKKRVGEIKEGNTGNLTVYAKWVKCTQKPKSDSAKLTACKATGTGKVSVKATIKKRVASSDDYYYLMYINPLNKKMYKEAAKVYKKKNITFSLKTAENRGYATSMFGIAVKKGSSYQLISTTSFVKNARKAASNKSKYKPGTTKKGMQFDKSMEEIIDCGARQNFLNVTVSMVCDNGTVPYNYNGKTYYFNPMTYYQQVVTECNKRNINVTMQVMLDWTTGHTDLIPVKARVKGAAPYYSWNVTTNSSREKMEAIFCYLGGLFGKKNCYVSNWILGNEVNNPAGWHYKGGMTTTAYFKSYAYAFRALYYAVKTQYSNAHIFICTDNFWNTTQSGGYSAKYVISAFLKQLNKIEKGLDWNLAYHAYSFPLTYTNFWEGFGITDDVNTPYITMKNIKILTDYIKKNYGSSVRIILSEQGYTSSSPWGEANQAAALVYSYYIAACNPMIDAFIIRSFSDNANETAQGLRMGIAGKEAFNAFKYMDTSQASKYTKKYRGMLGVKSWKKIVSGYKTSRIKGMYRKT